MRVEARAARPGEGSLVAGDCPSWGCCRRACSGSRPPASGMLGARGRPLPPRAWAGATALDLERHLAEAAARPGQVLPGVRSATAISRRLDARHLRQTDDRRAASRPRAASTTSGSPLPLTITSNRFGRSQRSRPVSLPRHGREDDRVRPDALRDREVERRTRIARRLRLADPVALGVTIDGLPGPLVIVVAASSTSPRPARGLRRSRRHPARLVPCPRLHEQLDVHLERVGLDDGLARPGRPRALRPHRCTCRPAGSAATARCVASAPCGGGPCATVTSTRHPRGTRRA